MGLTFSREGLENQKCYGTEIPLTQTNWFAKEGICVLGPCTGKDRVKFSLEEAKAACSSDPNCTGILAFARRSFAEPFWVIQVEDMTLGATAPAYQGDAPSSGLLSLIPVTPCPPADAAVESSSSAPDSAGLVAGGSSPLPNTQSDFEQALALYRSNYVQFLSSGNPAYKTAYQNAQDAIEKVIQDRQSEVEEQKHDMKRFADSYQEGNSELSDIYDSASGLFMNAQQIEDTYRTAKQRYDEVVAPGSGTPVLDVANGYAFLLRFGLILIFLPILFLIGWWSPQIKAAASSAASTAATAVTAATAPLMSSPTLGPMRT
jgi:hypothetical protein